MNIKKITNELEKQYPGKKIIVNNEKNPTEILCEAEPASAHPEYSIAITVIDKSETHVHHKTAEIYQVLKGSLTLVKNGRSTVLKEGEVDIIRPGEVHYAMGTETWVRVYSEPGWSAADHIIMSGEAARPVMSFTHERLLVTKFAECLTFYTSIMGFEAGFKDETHQYAELKTGDTLISLFDARAMLESLKLSATGTVSPQSHVLVFSVEDIDKAYNFFVREKHVAPLKETTEYKEWGIKAFHISDPEGNIIEINQKL
ncbi:MAG: VOC family protein [Patescibacteria group bacterium]|jgi:mannose-6-phosphate isomerase-like protein (cupin superfamily)/catechol 2,3-dioxygenase-like lactoylglutathione lyase family enzyme